MKNKRMTINDLAVMVKTGFDEAQKDRGKIREEIKEGFFQVRQEMGEGFLNVNARLDMLEGDMSEVKDRLSNVEGHVLEIKETLPQFVTRAEFEPVLNRLKIIEKKLGLKSI